MQTNLQESYHVTPFTHITDKLHIRGRAGIMDEKFGTTPFKSQLGYLIFVDTRIHNL